MRLGLALVAVGAALAFAPTASLAQKKSKDLITREEIDKSGQTGVDVLQLIKALRPTMLDMPRGVRTMGNGAVYPILVVVDGRRGEAEMLTSLQAADVKEIRYLDPNKSQNEYGINANSGAIVIKTLQVKDKDKPKDKPNDR